MNWQNVVVTTETPTQLDLVSYSYFLTMQLRSKLWRYQRISEVVNRRTDERKRIKQLSTKHYIENLKRSPLKSGDELRCFGRVGSSCWTRDIRRATPDTHPKFNFQYKNIHLIRKKHYGRKYIQDHSILF